jgi:hypothetical protein
LQKQPERRRRGRDSGCDLSSTPRFPDGAELAEPSGIGGENIEVILDEIVGGEAENRGRPEGGARAGETAIAVPNAVPVSIVIDRPARNGEFRPERSGHGPMDGRAHGQFRFQISNLKFEI